MEYKAKGKILRKIYHLLFRAFGPQHWWPAETPFEVIIGAILTQNTAWANVEKAIANMKAAGCLSPEKIKKIPLPKLTKLIRPSGYYNIKAKRLKSFVNFLFAKYRGSLPQMFKTPFPALRRELLEVSGIGQETADSILLYAANKPIFVIDAYTRRILERHQILREEADYAQAQELFMRGIKSKANLFNEYHALIVRVGKDFCRKNPLCVFCPLKGLKP